MLGLCDGPKGNLLKLPLVRVQGGLALQHFEMLKKNEKFVGKRPDDILPTVYETKVFRFETSQERRH